MIKSKKITGTEVMRDLSGYFKQGERRRICNAAENLRDTALIRLLWISGRRISEVLGLRVLDINFEIDKIAFKILKKKLDVPYKRLKPMDKRTKELLIDYIKHYGLQKEDFLFPSPKNINKPITSRRAYDIIRTTAKKVGIVQVGGKPVHPHLFRHSFAIDYARKMKSPADIRKLQKLMEHSSLEMTETYLQFGEDETDNIDEYIGD